jgi:glutathione S-transferase
MAPHIALLEAGARFEARPLSFHRRENQTAAYLALNPEGKVPTLVVDGAPLTEVAAILFYIARRFPEPGLIPKSLEGEAQAVSWMSFIASTLHPARQQGMAHAATLYAIADRRLGERNWVLGDYSIADIHLFRLYWRFRDLLREAGGAFPRLDAHYQRMMGRAAVQRTIADEAAIGYELPSYPAKP